MLAFILLRCILPIDNVHCVLTTRSLGYYAVIAYFSLRLFY